MTTTEDRDYLPAMSRHMPLAFYDAFTRLLGVRDAHWRLVAQAGIEPGATVLEIGTGTGALLLLAKRAVPDATVIGLDPDPRVLAIAARKARRAGVTLRLDRGYADRLPYPDGSVDRVLSAFMLHHLPADQQHDALREVRRVLAPGGRLHLLDIDGSAPSAAGRLLRLGHLHTAEDHGPGSARAACARRPRRRARRLREGRPGGRRRGRPRRDAARRVQLLPRGPLTPYRRYHPPGPASAVAAAGPHDPWA